MKKIIILVGMACLLGLAIPSYAQYRSDSCGCGIPIEDTSGLYQSRVIPRFYDEALSLSPDGKYLALYHEGGIYLLNLQTLELTQILVTGGGLPHENDVGYSTPIWCPYDPDLLALNVTTLDPHNNGGSGEVVNIYTYRVSSSESTLITPNIYGPFIGAGLLEWLLGSKAGLDSLIIGYSGGIELYITQTQTLVPEGPEPGTHGIPEILALSPDGKHQISCWIDTNMARDSNVYYLDDKPLRMPRKCRFQGFNFSPNSNLVAISVSPPGFSGGDTIFEQVWIFSSDSASPSNVMVINFQCLFCMYNFDGANAVFLTDSTIAVSMHKDLADTAALYEITIDGRMVRQLTYVPQSRVATAQVSSLSLTSSPNPFPQSTQIAFTSENAGYADVSVVNLLGAEVAGLFDGVLSPGEHQFSWDATGAPPGMYECVIRMNGNVQHIPLLVVR